MVIIAGDGKGKPIPITYLRTILNEPNYAAWRKGDTSLSWKGAESGQGQYRGQSARGSPMVWTTNDSGNAHYVPENK